MTSVVPDRRAPSRPTYRVVPRPEAPVDVRRPVVRAEPPRTPAAVRVVGRPRGLPAAAAVVLAAVVALLGAGLGVLLGSGGTGRAAGFVTGSVLAALLVRRDRLTPVLVATPLLHAALLLLGVLQDGGPYRLVTVAMELFTAMVLSAPSLLIGTAAVLAVAVVRRPRSRR